MATAAFNSPEPVLNNRFIRVFYYRPPAGNVAGQRGHMIGTRGRGGGRGGGAYKRNNMVPAGPTSDGGSGDAIDGEVTAALNQNDLEGADAEEIDPDKLANMKRTVPNVSVEEPKIVEEARNKQKEKRNEALEKERVLIFQTQGKNFRS